MDFSEDGLREAFHALTAQVSDIQEGLEPLRDELKLIVSGDSEMSLREARAREEELRNLIRAGQAALFPLEQQRGAAARALKGQTGALREDAQFLANS